MSTTDAAAATTDTPATDAAGDGGAAGATDAAAAATTPDAEPVEEAIADSAKDAVSVHDAAASKCLPTDRSVKIRKLPKQERPLKQKLKQKKVFTSHQRLRFKKKNLVLYAPWMVSF